VNTDQVTRVVKLFHIPEVTDAEIASRLSSVRRNNLTWRLPMGLLFVGFRDGEYLVKRP
jgi:hypothetical protein